MQKEIAHRCDRPTPLHQALEWLERGVAAAQVSEVTRGLERDAQAPARGWRRGCTARAHSRGAHAAAGRKTRDSQVVISVDLVPTNGKRMVYLDSMSPRGQEQAFYAVYGACGRFGEPLGACWGLRRASNGLKHARAARTVKRFGTVNVQVLPWLSRGAPLAE